MAALITHHEDFTWKQEIEVFTGVMATIAFRRSLEQTPNTLPPAKRIENQRDEITWDVRDCRVSVDESLGGTLRHTASGAFWKPNEGCRLAFLKESGEQHFFVLLGKRGTITILVKEGRELRKASRWETPQSIQIKAFSYCSF